MEERRSARRVTQHQLGVEPDDATERTSDGPDAPPASPPGTDPPTPPRSTDPSDTALRERQRVWWRERARFEAAKRRPTPSDEVSK